MTAAKPGHSAPTWDQSASPDSTREKFAALRIDMVKEQIAARGVTDSVVLDAMRSVPREQFVPPQFRDDAYEDRPLPIGYGQTISQPYIVGLMTQSLGLSPRDRVLEIGTGSGYQAAVLAEIVEDVFTIEIVEQLGQRAQESFVSLGYTNIHVRINDGHRGWPDKAPYDAIILTAAPEQVPQVLFDQLVEGGRLTVPVGGDEQTLVLFTKSGDRMTRRDLSAVRFVPMTGEP